MKSIICTLSLLVILSTTCFAVSSYPDPWGYEFRYSPVAEINGMAEAGVALARGGSVFFNPAHISSPVLQERYIFTITPKRAEVSHFPSDRHNILFANVRANILRHEHGRSLLQRIDIGYFHSYNNLDIAYTDYLGGLGGYLDGDVTTNALILGISGSYAIDISIGGTLRLFGLTGYDMGGKTYSSYDVGVLIGLPVKPLYSDYIEKGKRRINVYPSFGLSYSNYGRGTYEDDNIYQAWMHIKRIGASARIALDKQGHYGIESPIAMTPSYEKEKISWGDFGTRETLNKIGVEIGILEAVELRIGNIESSYAESSTKYDRTTKGFSVNSRGLFRLFNRVNSNGKHSIPKLLTMRMNVQFSYAMKQYYGRNLEHYELTLQIY